MNAPGEILYILPFGERTPAFTAEEFEAGVKRGRALARSTATAAPSGAPEPLLTGEQISEVTGIPGPWFLDQARLGQIPHIKLGKYSRFRLSEVVQHGAVTPPTGPGGEWARKGKRAVP